MGNFKKMDSSKDMSTASPMGEVGEIDTMAPFQSVKAAASLFGEVAVSKKKLTVRRKSSENVLEKGRQLLLARRELNKIKKELESVEAATSKALAELEKAEMTLQDLTTQAINVRESKEAAAAVKNQANKTRCQLNQNLWILKMENFFQDRPINQSPPRVNRNHKKIDM